MKEIIINMGLMSLAFLSIFIMAEILHYHKVKTEFTRKLVHFGSGALALSFPLLFDSSCPVFALCGSFLVILKLSKKQGHLQSVHAVKRKTHGAALFPIVVMACFSLMEFTSNLQLYYLPLLVLAISDPLAALVGKRFPYGKYTFRGHTKTILGSLGFLFSAFLLALLVLSSEMMDSSLTIKYALIAALAATGAEALSKDGFDNLTIPLSIIVCLLQFQNLQLC